MNVFNRVKINIFSFYKSYNYRIKFIKSINKIKLLKSRINFILDYKLKQIKKYLNKNFKKEFIILNKISFALLILFAKKLNNKFRFYINYCKFN